MESEKNSVPRDSYSQSSQVSRTEYAEGANKNIPEENGCSPNRNCNINIETDTSIMEKGQNSVEINLSNHNDFLWTSLQTELDFEDEAGKTETSRFEHFGRCQTQKEGDFVYLAEEKSMETGDDPVSTAGDDSSEALSLEGGMSTSYKSEHSDEDELEEGELKDATPSPNESPPHICPFYGRGKCTWGDYCNYLHPNDKGSYCMFSPVRLPPEPPAVRGLFEERSVPYFHGPSLWGMNAITLRPVTINETPPECPWESDLKQIKELIKSKRVIERETTFGDKRCMSGSNEKYETNKDHCRKNQTVKHCNINKRKHEMLNACDRGCLADTCDRDEIKNLRKDHRKQSKPINKTLGLHETDKRDEKQTRNAKLSMGIYEMSKRSEIQTARPRDDGQNNSKRDKLERLRRTWHNSCASRSDAGPPKLSAQKKYSPLNIKPRISQSLSVLLREYHSTKNKYSSSKLLSKSQSPYPSSNYSKNSRSDISYAKSNGNHSTDYEAKKLWQKSCYEDLLSSTRKQTAKNEDQKFKPKHGNSYTSSCSVSVPHSAQKKLWHSPKTVSLFRKSCYENLLSSTRKQAAKNEDQKFKPKRGNPYTSSCSVSVSRSAPKKRWHSPKKVSLFQNMPSKCLPTAKTCTPSLAAGHSKRRLTHSQAKSLLAFPRSPSRSLDSSVSSITSSTSDSTVSNRTERLVSHCLRDEIGRLVRYGKQRCNEKIPAGAAKCRGVARHSKQEMPVRASIKETLYRGTTKNFKDPFKDKVVAKCPKMASRMPQRDRKIKEEKSNKDVAFCRGMSKMYSKGSQLIMSASCKPTVNCVIKKPCSRKETRSRKERLILLLKAIEEAIDRKRNVSK